MTPSCTSGADDGLNKHDAITRERGVSGFTRLPWSQGSATLAYWGHVLRGR